METQWRGSEDAIETQWSSGGSGDAVKGTVESVVQWSVWMVECALY